MADTIIVSTSDANMVDYPLAIQAAGADTPIQYGAQEHMRQLLDALTLSTGRLKFGEFVLTQRAAGANFSVDLSAGYYIVAGTTAPTAQQGKYLIHTTGVVNITVPAAPASGTRVHRVVAQILDKAVDGGSAYGWRIWLREDTGSGTPAVPANAENIGTISVSAGQANVSNANITDSIKYAAVQHGGLGMIYTKEYDTTGTTLYTGSPTGATEFTGVSLPCWLFAGRRYTFRFRVRHDNTVSTARQFFTVHAGNSSTDVDITRRIGFQMIYIPVSGLVPNDLIQFDWEPTADGFYYLNLGLLVSSGTATVYRGTSNDRTWITVEDKGSNSYDRLIRTTGA